MNETIRQKIDELKLLIDSLSENEIKLITRGERPKRITIENFKVLRKTIQENIQSHLMKGKQLYSVRIPIYNKDGKLEGYNKVLKPYINKGNK